MTLLGVVPLYPPNKDLVSLEEKEAGEIPVFTWRYQGKTMGAHSHKVAMYKPGSPGSESAGMLILDLLASVGNEDLLFKPPSLWCFVRAAQRKTGN